jgi:serine/threonine protein kinase
MKDLEDDVTVKIADFGFAARVAGKAKTLSTQCGTPG